jgi:hypothetical protein
LFSDSEASKMQNSLSKIGYRVAKRGIEFLAKRPEIQQRQFVTKSSAASN